jgi:hypothetical protein
MARAPEALVEPPSFRLIVEAGRADLLDLWGLEGWQVACSGERKILQAVMMTAAALIITGCGTTTRMASFGPLPGGTSLVTLVVS